MSSKSKALKKRKDGKPFPWAKTSTTDGKKLPKGVYSLGKFGKD